MTYDGSKAKEILIHFLMIATIVAIPFLTALAYRGWARRWRQQLPRWRSALGLSSMAVIFFGWFSLVILALSNLMHINTSFYSPDWVGPIALVILVGTALAFALRGTPRFEAILAGVLMIIAWLTSVVS